jgi:hypothetical protein
MGFHLVKPVVYAGPGQIGNMWTSIPFNRPYSVAGDLCADLGLTSTGFVRGTVTVLNPATGYFSTVACGTLASNALQLVRGRGVQLRQPNIASAPESMAILGSHDNALELTIPDAGEGQIGNLWYSVPYHTTAVTAADLCSEIGMSNMEAMVTRLDATTGVMTSVTCGTQEAGALTLVNGESVRLRDPNGPKTFLPAHY